MAETISDNQRIAKNTIVLYVRMVIMMFLSFYTSRIILEALGIVNLGIFNIVGGILSILGLINASMSLSVQRFLAFDLGKQDKEALNATFSTSVIIHLGIALIIVVLGETVGYYFLTHYINYPPERHEAVLWVFHLSVLGSFLGIIQIPYSAIIVAYERMHIYAYFTILDVAIRLLLIYLLFIVDGDKLIFFAVFNAVVGIVMFIIYRLYFHIQFRDIKFQLKINKSIFKKLFNFAGWSTFGEFAWAGTNQGTDILLNLYFGPATNGVRGMAYQIQSIVMRFVMSFQGAINPQVIKRYAAGETTSMRTLVYQGTCFSFYLSLLLALPFLIEADFLLGIWLISVPTQLSLFAKLILINVFLDMLTNLHAAAAKAYGRIGRYQMIVSLFLSLNFIFSFIVLHIGMPAYSVFIVYSGVSLSLIIVRLLLLRQMIPVMTISSYVKQVIIPIIKVTTVACITPLIANYLLPESWICSILICFISVISVAGSVWFIGLNSAAKKSLIRMLTSAVPYIGKCFRPRTATVTWITWHNYGSFLQAYALQQVVISMGFRNRIICDKHLVYPSHGSSLKDRWICTKSTIKRILRKRATSAQLFHNFKRKYLLIEHEHTSDKLNKKYNTILCGSDQIWSPYLKFEPFYYLAFHNGKKIAYAPSLGTTFCPQEYKDNVYPLLRSFSALSVREEANAVALSNELNREVNAVLDPTLLLTGTEWKQKLLSKDRRTGGFILCYFLTPNKWYIDYVAAYAKQQNKPLKVFNTHAEYHSWGECVQAGPQEFLSLINAADEIFTDSFHATIFSILFHKRFTTFKRFEDGGEKDQNLRILNLFSKLNILDHFIGAEDLDKIPHVAPPDYQSIEEKLSRLRSESLNYLTQALTK